MKAKTLRKLAERVYKVSSKVRGGYPYKKRVRPRVLLSVRIQSLSEWFDKRAYIKENGQLPQPKETIPYELCEETIDAVTKRFLTRS